MRFQSVTPADTTGETQVGNDTAREPQQENGTPGIVGMKVRLTRKLSELINGVDLSKVHIGDTLDLSNRDALTLIAEGWAAPIMDAPPERDRASDHASGWNRARDRRRKKR